MASHRRLVLLIPAVLAFVVPVGMAVRAPRPETAPPPAASEPGRPAEPPTDSVSEPSPAPAAAAPETPIRPGWLRVTLELPPAAKDATVHAMVFTAKGTRERSEEFSGVDRFLLGPLQPGPKALLLFSRGGRFGALATEAVVSEGEEVDLTLRAPGLFRLEGTVVDAAGLPLPRAEVEIQEFFPWKQEGLGLGGSFGGRATVSSRGGGSRYSYSSSSKGLRFSTASYCDQEGHFTLWVGSETAAVTVRLLRDSKLVLETAVLPGTGPLRLVAPDK